jgi:uncharacterized protein with NAD-binding domain and iron-sulfur cluster
MAGGRRIRVAVLGGGCGAMSAAFELTRTAELRARYDVTVYQQGWRLGGKGASGREGACAQRIQEHGLHAFLGFYENAFRLMKDAYDEWDKPPGAPFQRWDQAFRPEWLITLQEPLAGGGWSTWNVTMPPLPGEPGDGVPRADEWRLLQRLLAWLDECAKDPLGAKHPVSAPPRRGFTEEVEAILARARTALESGPGPVRSLSHWLLDAAHTVVQWLAATEHVRSLETRRALLNVLTDLRVALIGTASHEHAEAEGWGRYWRLFQLACAIGIGIANDVLPPWGSGFDGINAYDFKDWLMWHGAPPEVAWSAPTIALYDLGFAYVGGVATRDNARAAAGVSLRVLLNLALGYKKAPLWKMQAGMGDTVFTPLYEVLAHQRGVRFEFFRRVQAIEASPDGSAVHRLRISRQADTKGGGAYEPLVGVKGLPCWPSQPKWDLLEGGDEMRRHPEQYDFESAWCSREVGQEVLELGRDFVAVVLGISVAALPGVAGDLVDRNPRWRQMVRWTKTVQTQSLQLWLRPALEGLGWMDGTTVMTGYAEPFDSWGEMSHLIGREDWPAGPGSPRSIEYFCGALDEPQPVPPFTDADFPAREHARVRQNAVAWLSRYVGHMWPRATTPDSPQVLDWRLLVDPMERSGEARLDAQFWRANIDPTERYVLSVPGSIDKRLAPGDSGFANLVLAGDWTKTSLDCGCAEAAIESGVLAARALVAFRG